MAIRLCICPSPWRFGRKAIPMAPPFGPRPRFWWSRRRPTRLPGNQQGGRMRRNLKISQFRKSEMFGCNIWLRTSFSPLMSHFDLNFRRAPRQAGFISTTNGTKKHESNACIMRSATQNDRQQQFEIISERTNMNHSSKQLVRCLGAALVSAGLWVGALDVARAADVLWTNTGAGNWSVSANWNSNAVPTAADRVQVNNGGTVRIDSTAASCGVMLGSSSYLSWM